MTGIDCCLLRCFYGENKQFNACVIRSIEVCFSFFLGSGFSSMLALEAIVMINTCGLSFEQDNCICRM